MDEDELGCLIYGLACLGSGAAMAALAWVVVNAVAQMGAG